MSTQPNITEVAQSFASVAQEFCSAVESAPNLDNIELLKRLYKILPELINEAICLPNVELNDDESLKDESEQQARRKVRLYIPITRLIRTWANARVQQSWPRNV